MLNYTLGMQSARSILWDNPQGNKKHFLNKSIEKKKEIREGTYQPITIYWPYLDSDCSIKNYKEKWRGKQGQTEREKETDTCRNLILVEIWTLPGYFIILRNYYRLEARYSSSNKHIKYLCFLSIILCSRTGWFQVSFRESTKSLVLKTRKCSNTNGDTSERNRNLWEGSSIVQIWNNLGIKNDESNGLQNIK